MKNTSFLIGFFMLFWLPIDIDWVIPYFFVWLPIAIALIAYSGAFIKLRQRLGYKESPYLRQYFATYPDRVVTIDELLEAMRLIPVTRKQLTGMIATGINEGWLIKEGDKFFSV